MDTAIRASAWCSWPRAAVACGGLSSASRGRAANVSARAVRQPRCPGSRRSRKRSAERRPYPDGRPAVGHAVGDAEGGTGARRPGVSFRRPRVERAVLPEPGEHPDRPVLPHHRRVHEPERTAVRRRRSTTARRSRPGWTTPATGPPWSASTSTATRRPTSRPAGTGGSRPRHGAFYDYRPRTTASIEPTAPTVDYGTNVLAARRRFIGSTPADRRLFLYFAPYAPHEPATRPRAIDGPSRDLAPWRPPSYDEPDVSDKPAYIRHPQAGRRADAQRSTPSVAGSAVVACRRSSGRRDRRRARGDRAAREHVDRVHLRQRDALGRAPVGNEARALRGEHPRAVRRALRLDDPVSSDRRAPRA